MTEKIDLEKNWATNEHLDSSLQILNRPQANLKKVPRNRVCSSIAGTRQSIHF